jgi:hypothetical protein
LIGDVIERPVADLDAERRGAYQAKNQAKKGR